MSNKSPQIRMSVDEFLKQGHSFDRKSSNKSRPQIKNNSIKMKSEDFMSNLNNTEKQTKYRSKITYVDGIMFHSAWEAKRYSILKIMEKANEISNLRLQVPYQIVVNNVIVTKYVADFVYIKKGKEVVEDAKGFITSDYEIKNKLMKAVFGIDIYETREKKPYRRKK